MVRPGIRVSVGLLLFVTSYSVSGQAPPPPPPPPPPPTQGGVTTGVIGGMIVRDPTQNGSPERAVRVRQQPTAEAEAPAGPPGKIRGTVMSTTGEPIRKADVICMPMMSPRGGGAGRMQTRPATYVTDASGAFECAELAPGNYRVQANHARFVMDQSSMRSAMIEVAAGQTVTAVSVKMSPHAVVAGKITDADGDPVANASVQVLREFWRRGKRTLMPAGHGQTNDLGEYRVPALTAGRYYLSVNATHRSPFGAAKINTGEGSLAYVTTYHPGTLDITQASLLTVAAGQELRGMDLVLRQARTFSVRGRVAMPEGTPFRNVSVSLTPDDGQSAGLMQPGGVARNEGGVFQIEGVAPGNYLLVAFFVERDRRIGGVVPVQVSNQDLEGITVALQPPVELKGTVRVEGDEKVDFSRMRIGLEAEPMMLNQGPAPKIESDGTFTMNVFAVRHRLFAMAVPEGTYLKAARYGQQDVVDGAFTVTPGAGLELVLSTKGASVTGTVVDGDGKPVPGAMVVVAPDAPNRERFGRYANSVTGPNGEFTAAGIAPAGYKVFVFAPGEMQFQNPAFLAENESRGTAVSFGEGERKNLTLTFRP